MYNTDQSYLTAFRPGTLVLTKRGSVGFISEVSINHCQIGIKDQLSYAVTWLNVITGDRPKCAWWGHGEIILASEGNIFDIFAIGLCHPHGNNKETAVKIMQRGAGFRVIAESNPEDNRAALRRSGASSCSTAGDV